MAIEIFNRIAAGRADIYFIRQFLAIIGIFVGGLIPIRLLRSQMGAVWDLLLSYPLGLSMFSVSGLLLLILGIPFNFSAIVVVYMLMIAGIIVYVNRKPGGVDGNYVNNNADKTSGSYVNHKADKSDNNYVNNKIDIRSKGNTNDKVDIIDKGYVNNEVDINHKKDDSNMVNISKKNYVNNKVNINSRDYVNNTKQKASPLIWTAGIIAVVILAAFSCSGILSQYVTNDSVYYYSLYPSILVREGVISGSLDKFLTDVGQGTAVLQCLPFMLSFDESFGLQHFLNLNFIAIFFACITDYAERCGINKKTALITAAAGTLFLASSEPFIVLSKWVLSNVYFMDFFFLLFFLSIKRQQDPLPRDAEDFILFFFTAFTAMSRMEGGVLVFVLVLGLSVLDIEKKQMIIIYGLPLFIMELGYYGRIFLMAGVDPLYSFLDIKTALLMAGMIGALFVYIIFIRERFPKKLLPFCLILLLLIGNLGLLVINTGRYTTNIRAFLLNIRQGNGWGSFIVVILAYAAVFCFEVVKRRGMALPVSVFLPLSVVLTIIAVCFARGGVLAVRVSDSGNRVLMEIVPILLFSLIMWWMDLNASRRKGGEESSVR